MRVFPFSIITLCLIIFFSLSASAQQPAFVSAIHTGGIFHDEVKGSVQDNNGNIYLVGTFYGIVDFDPGPNVVSLSSFANGRCYIMKLDSNGTFIWAKNFGNTASASISTDAFSVALDQLGNIYITGRFGQTADFDPGPATFNLTSVASNRMDIFVLKLNANAGFVWAKTIGNGTEHQIGTTIVSDGQSNLYVGGRFSETLDFDPGPNIDTLSGNWNDQFIWKIDTAGNHVWAKQMSDTTYSGGAIPSDCQIDQNGNLYFIGDFFGTVDFDPGPNYAVRTSNGSFDFFISKYDSTGQLVWVHSFGSSTGNDRGAAIDLSPNGDILTTGYFKGTIDFDPGPNVNNITAAAIGNKYILKLDINGNFVFVKSFGGTSGTNGYEIKTDVQGNIYTLGTFRNTPDFDPGPGTFTLTANTNTSGIFVSKLDSNGTFNWAAGFMGAYIASASEMFIAPSGDLVIAGSFDSTYDFNPSPSSTNILTTNGQQDIFICKLKQCYPNSFILYDTACTNYTFGSQILTTSGTYKDTLTNATGCDSIITLNLIIYNATSSTINDTACNSYNFAGQTIIASGTYFDTLTNAANCDSIISLNLIINSPSSFSFSDTACTSYNFNNQTLTLSGNYLDTLVNVNGCDSLVNLNLTINNSTSFTFSDTTCNSYNFNNQTLTASGIYKDTLVNANNCDSIITLNLVIKNSPTTTLNQTACDTYIFGGQMLTSSGSYSDTIAVIGSCDSIVTLNLTINTVNNLVIQNNLTLTVQETGATYQWLSCNPYSIISGETNQSFAVINNGSYAVEITKNNCVDTSMCFDFTNVSAKVFTVHENIKLFPNPTSSILNLETSLTDKQDVRYIIKDASGRTILEGKITNGKNSLDLSGIANGVYFIQLSDNEIQIGSLNFIKE